MQAEPVCVLGCGWLYQQVRLLVSDIAWESRPFLGRLTPPHGGVDGPGFRFPVFLGVFWFLGAPRFSVFFASCALDPAFSYPVAWRMLVRWMHECK